MTDDDWAPLPTEAQCAHPGEFAALAPRPVGPAQPSANAGPAAVPVLGPAASPIQSPPPTLAAAPSVPDAPAVTAALQALRARIAEAPAPSSMVAEVMQRERTLQRRAQLRQESVQRRDLAATLVVGSEPRPVPPPDPVVEYADGREGRDPREESDWFLTLPDTEQQRLRHVWADKRAQGLSAGAVQRRNQNRRFVAALFVFAAVLLLGTGVNWHATIGAGIVTGIWWRHAGADRFLDPLRACGVQFVMQGLAMAVTGQPGATMFFDAPLLVAFAALVGFDGEIRRTGGFDAS